MRRLDGEIGAGGRTGARATLNISVGEVMRKAGIATSGDGAPLLLELLCCDLPSMFPDYDDEQCSSLIYRLVALSG